MDNKTITMPYSEYKELLEEAHNTTYKKFGKTEEEIMNIISEDTDKDKLINELQNGREKLQEIVEKSLSDNTTLQKEATELKMRIRELKDINYDLHEENTKLKEQLESLKSKKRYQFWK